MIKVSVLISVYNGEAFIREAIDSVLAQTLTNIELVVVNDGSTDNTDSIIRTYKDVRIKYIGRPHEGRVPALNSGLGSCSGEYIAILDADDVYLPDKLEKQLNYMDRHSLTLCGSWATIVDENGRVAGEMTYPPIDTVAIRRYSLLHNPFIHSTVVMRSRALFKAGSYRLFRYGVEDYELWTRLMYTNKVGNMPEKLIRYRQHANQATKKVNIKMRLNALRVRILASIRYVSSFLE